jgi:hypothetical protein
MANVAPEQRASQERHRRPRQWIGIRQFRNGAQVSGDKQTIRYELAGHPRHVPAPRIHAVGAKSGSSPQSTHASSRTTGSSRVADALRFAPVRSSGLSMSCPERAVNSLAAGPAGPARPGLALAAGHLPGPRLLPGGRPGRAQALSPGAGRDDRGLRGRVRHIRTVRIRPGRVRDRPRRLSGSSTRRTASLSHEMSHNGPEGREPWKSPQAGTLRPDRTGSPVSLLRRSRAARGRLRLPLCPRRPCHRPPFGTNVSTRHQSAVSGPGIGGSLHDIESRRFSRSCGARARDAGRLVAVRPGYGHHPR